MKFSIDWHADCLKNSRFTLSEIERRIEILTEQANRLRANHSFYESQINEAVSRKLSEFDRDKFLIKRRKK